MLKNVKYSEVLRQNLKNFKISGVAIAEKVGLSQKSISRYTTGETTPNSKTAADILAAVYSIINEKKINPTQQQKELLENLKELTENIQSNLITNIEKAYEIIKANYNSESYFQDDLEDESFLFQDVTIKIKKVFDSFPIENQKFFLDNFDYFKILSLEDLNFLINLSHLNKKQQDYIIEQLQNIKFSDEFIKHHNINKMIIHLNMIEAIKKLPEIIVFSEEADKMIKMYSSWQNKKYVFDEFVELFKKNNIEHILPSELKSDEVSDFGNKFCTCNEDLQCIIILFLPILLTLDKEDIYILYLIFMNRLVCEKSYKLEMLFNYVYSLVDEENKTK